MKKLIIANWKMNLTLEESIQFCIKVTEKDYPNKLIISPPAPYLAYLANRFKSIAFCAQNVSHFEHQGAYTGEYSAALIKSSDINYSLISHSERRHLFSEVNSIAKQKAENCLKVNITPIICIGESLETRKNGTYKEFILKQLAESLPSSNMLAGKQIIIAYEPIWSIGTGLTLSDKDLIEMFNIINGFRIQIANNVSLVYGGSVSVDNIIKILLTPGINGVLVGRNSLDYQTFAQMLNI